MMDEFDENINGWFKKAEELFNFAENAIDKFTNGDLYTKRDMASCLGSHLSLKKQKVFIQLEKPLVCVQKMVPEINTINDRLAPLKNGLTKQKLWRIYDQSPELLAYRDVIRTFFGLVEINFC